MTRRRLFSILSLIFVLALTTTAAIAAKPRFSSPVTFTLAAPGSTASQSLSVELFTNSSSQPIALVANGELADLAVGQKYKVEIDAKGKAEIVCRSDDDYHGSSPKTVDVTASGSTTFTASSDHKSYQVSADDVKVDSKKACDSDYSNTNHKSRVTILKVMYSSGDVTLFEQGSKGQSTSEIGSLAFNGHDKSKPVDKVEFSKCKTKDLNVYCKQKGSD
jgi:hypothetical protein